MTTQRRGRRKSASAKAPVGAWDLVLERFDSRVLRRARVAIKQGEVGAPKVSHQRIVASVKRRGPDRRVARVSLPLVDIWAPYHKSVATWFCQRPDWLAALLAGSWDMSFLEFIDGTGLHLFPNAASVENWLGGAECNCSDWETPCRHVAALVVQIADEVTASPIAALQYVGLSVEDLLHESHRLTVERIRMMPDGEPSHVRTVEAEVRENEVPWLEEVVVLTGSARLPDGSSVRVDGPVESSGKERTGKPTKTQTMMPTLDEHLIAERVERYLRLT